MANNRINSGGWLAIGLGIIAGIIGLAREIVIFRRSGVVDWVHLVIALCVPILIYAMVRSRSPRQP